jgi:hypothetical protein
MIKTRLAATILGQSPETMKKWRQRRTGPQFVRDESGSIGYRLSVIMQYRNDRIVKRSSRKRSRKARS